MLLCGCTVESTVVGGPAYNSGQIERGDVILQVDGVAVTAASCRQPRKHSWFQSKLTVKSFPAGEYSGAPDRKRCPREQYDNPRNKSLSTGGPRHSANEFMPQAPLLWCILPPVMWCVPGMLILAGRSNQDSRVAANGEVGDQWP